MLNTVKADEHGRYILTPDTLANVCLSDQVGACAYLVCGGEGLECSKFTKTGPILALMAKDGRLHARRLGDCEEECGEPRYDRDRLAERGDCGTPEIQGARRARF